MVDVICRHCRKKKVNRPRGLCVRCYYAPGVKEQYPVTSKYAPRTFEVARANQYTLVCDHCGLTADRAPAGRGLAAPWPAGWRRVNLDESERGATVTECPDCAIAWDLEQMRRTA